MAVFAEAQRDPELAATKVDFAEHIARTLHLAVTGLLGLDRGAADSPPRG